MTLLFATRGFPTLLKVDLVIHWTAEKHIAKETALVPILTEDNRRSVFDDHFSGAVIELEGQLSRFCAPSIYNLSASPV